MCSWCVKICQHDTWKGRSLFLFAKSVLSLVSCIDVLYKSSLFGEQIHDTRPQLWGRQGKTVEKGNWSVSNLILIIGIWCHICRCERVGESSLSHFWLGGLCLVVTKVKVRALIADFCTFRCYQKCHRTHLIILFNNGTLAFRQCCRHGIPVDPHLFFGSEYLLALWSQTIMNGKIITLAS